MFAPDPILMPPDTLYLEPHDDGAYAADFATADAPAGAVATVVPFRLAAVATLEATHTFDGRVVLHDHRELGGDVRWRLRSRKITLGSMPTATLPADPRVGGTGTIGRRGTLGARTITYGGAIEAVDAAALRDGTAALLAIGWDVAGDLPVVIDCDDAAWTFSGRAVPDVVDNTSLKLTAVPTPYQAEFTVAIVMTDPRIYAAAPFVDVGALTPAGGDGPALPWPRLPVVLRPGPELSTTSTVEILGRIPTAPTFRVHGPRGPVVLTDTDRDVRLVVDVDVPADEWIDVDLRAARITSSTGEDLTDAIRWPDSTWWAARHRDVRPGPLHLRIDSLGVGAGATVDVIHHPAFP